MNSFYNWIAMGGYAGYVWSAYGVACAVLALNLISITLQKKHMQKKLRLWFKRAA